MSGDRRWRGDRGRSGTLYCSSCGDALEPSMNYCPNCGAPSGGDAPRSRSRGAASTAGDATTDREVLEYRIASAAQDGWELEHDFGDHVVMVRRTFGGVNDHLLVAVLTAWWTMGVGNALYGAYRYVGDAERIVLRADRAGGEDEEGGSGWDTVGRLAAAVCWVTAAVLAGVAVLYSGTTAALVFAAIGLVFAAVGVGALPSVRRRLAGRHPVTTNGRTYSVDERVVVTYDRPCAACSDPVGRGLERTYREEFCLLGVPLSVSEGRNYYCRQCANAETPLASSRRGSKRTKSSERATAVDDRSVPSAEHPEPDPDREPESS